MRASLASTVVTRSCPTCATSYPDETFFCGSDGSITVQDQDGTAFDPRLGKQLGGYIVVARVADGAMGRVYEGRHPETKARVAVKVLHEQVARDRVAVERFKREYEAAKEMNSPYIVRVHEFGDTPDRSFFMTMEYLQGRELSKTIEDDHAARKPLPLPRIVRTVCQLAAALDHAHSFGFIHRDLKPDNIFLCDTPTGTQVRVLDFGSVKLQMETGAKLTALGTTLGSPYYMSPEQATGATDVDQRSDVFALGAILYEMLTGKVAFEAPSVALILMKILNQQPAPPSGLNPECGPAIDAVVEKALRKDKGARYDSARKLAEQLLQACGLSTAVEDWAQKPEAEVALALAERHRQKTPAPSAVAQAPAASHRAGSSHAPSAGPSPAPAGRVSRASDVPMTVPNNAPKAKLIVSIAIGVAVLCLLALLMR
jgi:serine/threonine protein kinase